MMYSSDDLVPNVPAHLARLQGGVPVTFASYTPGDFAVFRRSRRFAWRSGIGARHRQRSFCTNRFAWVSILRRRSPRNAQ